jgi:hypothetical protein
LKRFLVKTAAALAAALLLSALPGVSADTLEDASVSMTDGSDGTICASVEYTTLDPEERYSFRKSIEDGDETYRLADTEREVIEVSRHRYEDVSTEETYVSVYSEDDVPESLEWTNPINGKTYSLPLLGCTLTESGSEERSAEITAEVDYGLVDEVPGPEETMPVSYTDPLTGKVLNGNVGLIRLEETEPFSWRRAEIPTTVTGADGSWYVLEGSSVRIPYTEPGETEIALDEETKEEIAAYLGKDASVFRVDSASWTSDEYERNGIICRDAVFTCERYLAGYKAHYSSVWELPPRTLYDALAVYGYEDGSFDVLDGTTEYTVRETAYYEIPEGTGLVLTPAGKRAALIGTAGLLAVCCAAAVIAMRYKKKADSRA